MIYKKSPLGRGAAGTGEKQKSANSTHRPRESQARDTVFSFPKDPFLRATHLVRQCKDLTAVEQLGLLVLWRYLGPDRKRIGRPLFGFLLNVRPEHAKDVLKGLRLKGYVGSTGKAGGGLQSMATRWLTKKSHLLKVMRPGVSAPCPPSNSTPGVSAPCAGGVSTQKQGAGTPTDLGVRHTDPGRSTSTTTTGASVEEASGNSDTEELFSIAEAVERSNAQKRGTADG